MTGRPIKAVRALEDQVEHMARRGDTAEDIGAILGLSRRTIYRRKLQKAMARGRAQLRQNLRIAQLKAAYLDRNPALLIWAGKQYLGQREPVHGLEISGSIEHEISSPDELRENILRRLARIDKQREVEAAQRSNGEVDAAGALPALGSGATPLSEEPEGLDSPDQ